MRRGNVTGSEIDYSVQQSGPGWKIMKQKLISISTMFAVILAISVGHSVLGGEQMQESGLK